MMAAENTRAPRTQPDHFTLMKRLAARPLLVSRNTGRGRARARAGGPSLGRRASNLRSVGDLPARGRAVRSPQATGRRPRTGFQRQMSWMPATFVVESAGRDWRARARFKCATSGKRDLGRPRASASPSGGASSPRRATCVGGCGRGNLEEIRGCTQASPAPRGGGPLGAAKRAFAAACFGRCVCRPNQGLSPSLLAATFWRRRRWRRRAGK